MANKIEKVLCMNVSATLAAAVIQNLPDNLPLDVDIKANEIRAGNIMCWELHRIFYHATVAAFDDDASWPPPKHSIDVTNGLPSAVHGLLGMIPAGWADKLPALLAPLLKDLLSQIGAPPAPANLPNPGGVVPKP